MSQKVRRIFINRVASRLPQLFHRLLQLLLQQAHPQQRADAGQEFQAVDGYAGAWPWQLHTDPAASFAATRAEALLGWQRAMGGR